MNYDIKELCPHKKLFPCCNLCWTDEERASIGKVNNQCDGCQRGLSLDEYNIHKGEGYDLMGCTKNRYKQK